MLMNATIVLLKKTVLICLFQSKKKTHKTDLDSPVLFLFRHGKPLLSVHLFRISNKRRIANWILHYYNNVSFRSDHCNHEQHLNIPLRHHQQEVQQWSLRPRIEKTSGVHIDSSFEFRHALHIDPYG